MVVPSAVGWVVRCTLGARPPGHIGVVHAVSAVFPHICALVGVAPSSARAGRAVGGLPRSRRRCRNEGHKRQVTSGLARGALQVAVGGGQSLPQFRALVAGGLSCANVDGARTDLDLGVRVGAQVEIPGRRAGGAGVRGHDDERVVVCRGTAPAWCGCARSGVRWSAAGGRAVRPRGRGSGRPSADRPRRAGVSPSVASRGRRCAVQSTLSRAAGARIRRRGVRCSARPCQRRSCRRPGRNCRGAGRRHSSAVVRRADDGGGRHGDVL